MHDDEAVSDDLQAEERVMITILIKKILMNRKLKKLNSAQRASLVGLIIGILVMVFGIYLEAQPNTLCNGSFLNYCYIQTTQYGSPAALGVIILGLVLIIIAVFFFAYERSSETRAAAAT